MRCPSCVAEGKKSRVFVGGSTGTCMHSSPYYDEDGVYHFHNANTFTDSYSCSNGHRWVVRRNQPCPADGCDYGKEMP